MFFFKYSFKISSTIVFEVFMGLIYFLVFFCCKRSYPSSSFWQTFLGRQQDMPTPSPREGIHLQLLDSQSLNNLIIKCGEVNGVVLGSWKNISESISDAVNDEDGSCSAYWTAAAVWSSAWDQRTIDRVSY